MPRFFFDTSDDDLFVPDDQGHELESAEAAALEAQTALTEMVCGKFVKGDQRVFTISVRDEANQVILRASLTLLVERSPPSA